MDAELKQALGRLAEERHPTHDWPVHARHVTLVEYLGIKGRSRPVRSWVVHPPRAGDHVRWMHFQTKTFDFTFTYYEVVQVLWDVRNNYKHLYAPGEEGESYLTVFLRPVKNSPGELLDRAVRGRSRRTLTSVGIAAF